MKLQALAVLLSIISFGVMAAVPGTPLNCFVGPVIKTYGGTPWRVYACDDGHSLGLTSDTGSKASPFMFLFAWENGQKYQLSGQGTGNKAATDAAFGDLHALTGVDLARLFAEVEAAAQEKKSN